MKIKFLKALNGDSILLSFNDGAKNRNILVDCGNGNAYYNRSTNKNGDLKLEVDSIKNKKEVIDLLILTHIDNDHICGLIEWFRRDKEAYKLINNIWFNSGKSIARYLNEPENNDLNVDLDIFTDPKTGVNEAIEFESFLEGKEIWNKQIVMQGVDINKHGVKIQVLSPEESQLRRLLKEYKKATGDDTYTAPKEKDWNRDIKDFIEEENQKTDLALV